MAKPHMADSRAHHRNGESSTDCRIPRASGRKRVHDESPVGDKGDETGAVASTSAGVGAAGETSADAESFMVMLRWLLFAICFG